MQYSMTINMELKTLKYSMIIVRNGLNHQIWQKVNYYFAIDGNTGSVHSIDFWSIGQADQQASCIWIYRFLRAYKKRTNVRFMLTFVVQPPNVMPRESIADITAGVVRISSKKDLDANRGLMRMSVAGNGNIVMAQNTYFFQENAHGKDLDEALA